MKAEVCVEEEGKYTNKGRECCGTEISDRVEKLSSRAVVLDL